MDAIIETVKEYLQAKDAVKKFKEDRKKHMEKNQCTHSSEYICYLNEERPFQEFCDNCKVSTNLSTEIKYNSSKATAAIRKLRRLTK